MLCPLKPWRKRVGIREFVVYCLVFVVIVLYEALYDPYMSYMLKTKDVLHIVFLFSRFHPENDLLTKILIYLKPLLAAPGSWKYP